ncbi:tetratricopeptide repeat protein [Thiobacter aerophilum]|uniref:Tetratricopeptide repeat protein n=1 Tax=Thiobacter aerophilum TaxID=3121275 RepID=A0ABV0ECB4_9BURK
MVHPALENLEKMLASGKDNALVRFALGNEYLKLDRPLEAAAHLRAALAFEPAYSAAWKLLGKALAQAGQLEDALAAYRQGIETAEKKGDKQAAKEMTVFARRIEKQLTGG